MITANMVKELREQTGAGMLDCKKALTETNGNMEEAVTWLREKGISKAAKKSSRIAAEGLAVAKVLGNKAVLVEVNSETDFVAKNEEFQKLVNIIVDTVMANDVTTVEEANEFIVYWLPLMQDNPYNIISFQTDIYTDAAKLNINPSPDTLIRVFMTWQSADKYVNLPEQQLSAPERNGFTVVEWGGTEIIR
mgnify:CR=1 FL=1